MKVHLTVLMLIMIFIYNFFIDISNDNQPEHAEIIIVAASDSSESAKQSADYVAPGVNDHLTIQEALNAVPSSGGEVLLMEGTYICERSIRPKELTTLRGEGETKTFIKFVKNDAHLSVINEGVTLRDFHVSGENYSYPYKGVVTIRVGHVTVRNVTGIGDSSIEGVFYVHGGSLPGYNKNIENIEFNNCKVYDAGSTGFVLNAGGSYLDIINTRFIDCVAINCGRESRYNPWVTGFLFAENNNLVDLVAINCTAEGNWESGFHVENPKTFNGQFLPAIKQNVTYIDCVSRNNDQKGKQTDERTIFGAGFMVSDDMHLINCTSENNRYGFLTYGGGFHIENSRDTDSWMGVAMAMPVDPSGTRITGTSLVNQVYPIHFHSGDPIDVVIDGVNIYSETMSMNTSGITITEGVSNPSGIIIKNSKIDGYEFGINNVVEGTFVFIDNISVYGAKIDFVNARIITSQA
ncbi:PemB family protein [Methanocalculus chunghsingensis]|uniref:glycosyl hydrolase family 28-related protein n=1 Tax=Methanocalculus chunghsingensis TaxID=156457 RepID=UPI001B8B4493|nr:glycosyl hydrolase family 28-related protein [Methanocalculus chunghsingensis]